MSVQSEASRPLRKKFTNGHTQVVSSSYVQRGARLHYTPEFINTKTFQSGSIRKRIEFRQVDSAVSSSGIVSPD